MLKRSFLVLSFLFAFPLLAAERPSDAAAERLQAFVKKHGIPGLSIAVSRDGKVWTHTIGVADLETKVPVSSDTVFPLGSTSKALTSLALGQLIEQRKLDLDAPVQKYVPYFPEKEEGVVTTRLLAGHLSGLRDYNMAAGEYANKREFESIEAAVGVFKDDPLVFTPGSKYAYSAYNFVLLSAAIEGASGTDYLTYMKRRVFDPLKLDSTVPDRTTKPHKRLVTTYLRGPFGAAMKATPVNVSNKWAAGGFASTPTEMVTIGNAILRGKIIRKETFELLTRVQKLSDGSDSGAGYAMGWRSGVRDFSGTKLRVVHHGGAANGAMSFFFIIPEKNLVVSMNGNLLFEPFTDFSSEAFAIAALFMQ